MKDERKLIEAVKAATSPSDGRRGRARRTPVLNLFYSITPKARAIFSEASKS